MKLTLNSNLPKEEQALLSGKRLIRFDVIGKSYPNEEVNRNVFLVDSEGIEIWRVAYHECVQGDDPFVGVDVTDEGVIVGLTWDGWKFEINSIDGSLKKIGWTKS
jgi:hypothetical protein